MLKADWVFMEVEGEAEINRRLLNLIRALPDEIDTAMKEEGEEILDAAKADCPWRTTALRDSGTLDEPENDGFNSTVRITFGTETAYYGIIVHEDLSARHDPPYGNGGHAKFLETASNTAKPGMSIRVGKRIQINRIMMS